MLGTYLEMNYDRSFWVLAHQNRLFRAIVILPTEQDR